MRMNIKEGDLEIALRPFKKEDLEYLSLGFQSMIVHRYTLQTFAQTYENEQEWYDMIRHSKEDVVWAIVQKSSWNTPIGITGLYKLDIFGSCSSGIVIWVPACWGKGIATLAHLGRTMFATDFLNRYTIQSGAKVGNDASFKALQKVGYHLVGIDPRIGYRDGKFHDAYRLCWINPERTSILFPEGVPEEYKESLEKARQALDKARRIVEFE